MTQYVLKDLIDLSKDGEWGKGEPFADSVAMLCIRGTDFGGVRFGSLDDVPMRHVRKNIAEYKSLRPWDLLIETAGGTKGQITGRTIILRPSLFGRTSHPLTCASFSRFVRLRGDLCDPQFTFWYLQHLYATGHLNKYHTQHTGVARFQWTTFAENEKLFFPAISIQRHIAGILSAYDELMELSQRRVRILETMAHSVYREWFVSFRFPGHENVPRLASSMGDIPQGWKVGRLDDVLVLQRGFDLPKTDRVEGTVPIYAATGVTGFHNEAKVRAPGVVTGRSGTIGDVLYVQDDFWPLNTVLWVKKFPNAEPLYAYFVLSSLDLKRFNSGAAVPTLNRNDVHGLDVLIPPPQLQKRFQEIAGTMLEQARVLKRQIESLQRNRDLLLPRLMSGGIDLSHLAPEPATLSA
jgi:type I restriction enzyme S subunit